MHQCGSNVLPDFISFSNDNTKYFYLIQNRYSISILNITVFKITQLFRKSNVPIPG